MARDSKFMVSRQNQLDLSVSLPTFVGELENLSLVSNAG